MSAKNVTRRAFLSSAAAASAVATMGCPRRNNTNGVKVFKRSHRGIHTSNAAKSHCANKLFKTLAAAKRGRAHRSDNCYVVELIINKQTYNKLFANGRLVADLRHHL